MIAGHFSLDPDKVVPHTAARRFAARRMAPGARVPDVANSDFRTRRLLPPVDDWAADPDAERLKDGGRKFPAMAVTTVTCDMRDITSEGAAFDAVITTCTLVHLTQLSAKRRAMRSVRALICNIEADTKRGKGPGAAEAPVKGRPATIERVVRQRQPGPLWALSCSGAHAGPGFRH